MSTSPVQPPKPPRPRNLVIIVVALGVIAALSAIGLLVTTFAFGRAAAFTRGNLPRNSQGGNFQGGGNAPGGNDNSQGGNGGNFQPGNGGGNFQPGNGGGNFQQRGGGGGIFSAFGIARLLGINFQYIRYITIAFSLIGIILTAVTAYFVWRQKRWALNLAIVLAILFLLGSLPGLFSFGGRFFSFITVMTSSMNILKALATLAIIVLGILPSVRDSVS